MPNSSVRVEYLVPNYVKSIIQLGEFKKEIVDHIPSSAQLDILNDVQIDNVLNNQQPIKADLIIIGCAAGVDFGHYVNFCEKILENNGQCIVFFNEESINVEKEIDLVLTSAGLMRYRYGAVDCEKFRKKLKCSYVLYAVKIGYNPVLHAREFSNRQQYEKAIQILEDIPEEFLSDNRLQHLLTIEKEKYRQISNRLTKTTLFVGLVSGENYGWGVCSRYLIHELSKILPIKILNEDDGSDQKHNLGGPLFQALTNIHFDAMFPNASGNSNFGYTFFENELTDKSQENAKSYDLIFGGSTWCMERMKEKGISNCDVLIQGIDPEIFYPVDLSNQSTQDHFVIFSGGKFELRKGQDLVLRAVKIMQDKYPDVLLINCWYNLWPASTKLMGYSKYINFQYYENESWTETMLRTYHDNGLDPSRIQTCELIPQKEQRALFAQTDIGVFPNRCEGGTNLVLMEYMACGKPVIASNNSGHKDIVTARNALLINHMSDFQITDNQGDLIARWQDPSLDELVAQLEYAYHNRDMIAEFGAHAGRDLKKFTWFHTAQRLTEFLPILS